MHKQICIQRVITLSTTLSFLTLLILPSAYLPSKRHIHVVDLYLSYLRPSAITLTTGTRFSSLRLSLLAFPSVSRPLQLSFSFTRCPKRSPRCAPLPSPLYVGDIDILHKSDMPLSVTEEKLMTEGCDRRGVELAGSYRSLAVYVLESVFV